MGKPPSSRPGKTSTSGKKPSAPSVRRSAPTGPTALIVSEIYAALERLGADAELLAIVGSWRDTLDEANVLSMLREYNAGRPTLHRRP